ncbi:cellular morphogenesis protein [Diplocarpon rosae]|nr:cellular morphogenesis protein [Diplocarpon rosae]
MKPLLWLRLSAADRAPLTQLALLLVSLTRFAHAITFEAVPSANLDLSQLGRVGLAGDFNGISLYQFEGQSENGFNTNGSQSILSRFPDGSFISLAAADAGIQAMCTYVMDSGMMGGVVVGGNFTSLAGTESQGVGLFNPNTSAVTPLTGLSGRVFALLCDQETNTVYVGGSFKGANSTNAIAWVGTSGWTDLPFAGFNGPTDGVDGAGNTWLLADGSAGSWKATFGFGFQPTKLRLRNTHLDGRGTKTWRYTAFPINGIMNFTYIDPETGANASCSSECPLSNNSSVKFQDFHFVNVIGMNSFQIDISAFYGDGGGLNGIELFQNDIFAYAINTFNEPSCAGIEIASNATSTGPWAVTPSQQSLSEYLTASINGPDSASVVFLPDIRQSGNYSVNIYTPGCIQDGTCTTRGLVNITGTMSSDGDTLTSTIHQTNNYDKYDQIYFGYIEAGSSSFRPSVTLSPADNQNTQNITIVAQRVGFELISSNGGLNSLFEYDPAVAVVDSAEFANSTFDAAGMSFSDGAGVNALQSSGSTTFVGGNFTTDAYNNIFAVSSSGATALAETGLNGEVTAMFLNGSTLYVGGKFTRTSSGATTGLSNVAAYDTSKNTWSALGAGVDGSVTNIVPLALNVTTNVPEVVITVTGDFQHILAFGNNSSVAVTGFAVWVPSRGNWLQNLNFAHPLINGQLTATVDLPDGRSFFAGSLSSSQLSASGAVALSDRTNGSTINNLVFINGSDSDTVTGIGSWLSNDSTILAMAIHGDTLYAGGSISGSVNGGSVNGLVSFDLSTLSLMSQPPSLSGGDVKSITVRPGSGDIYAGGSFSAAGSLGCPAVCVYVSTAAQWDRPGSNLAGTANAMTWASSTSLVAGGDLTLDGANISLASYDTKAQSWTAATGASSIPGPVAALTAANSDASELWVAGTASNGSTFLMRFDGTTWLSVGDRFGSGTNIRGLQVLPLSKDHEASDFLSHNQDLMITGSINLPGFGNASAVLFNGTTFQPFALTSSASNTSGSLSQIFSQRQNFFKKAGGKLAKGFVVLIALAIALGLIFFLVVAGVAAERFRRKREGYVPAPTASFDRNQGLSRVPPEQLFGSLAQGRSGIEKQSTRI